MTKEAPKSTDVVFDPVFGKFVPPQGDGPHPVQRAIGSLIGLTGIWAVIAVVYWSGTSAVVGNCGPPSYAVGQTGEWHGGPYASASVGAAIGGALWALAGILAWRLPRRRGTVIVLYPLLYISALLVLWYGVSPLIWRHQYCVMP